MARGRMRRANGWKTALSEQRRAEGAHTPAETTSEADPRRDGEQADRVVVVDALDNAWRVQAAHMEPLRFRSAAEADRVGHRVARTLARLGFNARLETYDALGDLNVTARYPGETSSLWRSPRRQLDS